MRERRKNHNYYFKAADLKIDLRTNNSLRRFMRVKQKENDKFGNNDVFKITPRMHLTYIGQK
jgi:hypothetical protein